jgi:predicted Rossmann fold nucleotide-binding protein DprA/Smf involved in DNA uptake
MKIAFSGTRDVPDAHEARGRILIAMNRFKEAPTDVFTGGAYGIDTIAAEVVPLVWPNAHHHLVVPEGCVWNEELLNTLPGFIHVHWITGGYLKRNDALIADADVLLAFPQGEVEQIRSGTWATVRRARKRGMDVRIYPLDSQSIYEVGSERR